MSFNAKKYMEKLEAQEKANHKEKYDQPFRGRSVVFKDKTKYDRNRMKQNNRRYEY